MREVVGARWQGLGGRGWGGVFNAGVVLKGRAWDGRVRVVWRQAFVVRGCGKVQETPLQTPSRRTHPGLVNVLGL